MTGGAPLLLTTLLPTTVLRTWNKQKESAGQSRNSRGERIRHGRVPSIPSLGICKGGADPLADPKDERIEFPVPARKRGAKKEVDGGPGRISSCRKSVTKYVLCVNGRANEWEGRNG